VDCDDDWDARAHLETCKERLHTHFRAKYDKPLPAPTAPGPVASTSTANRSPQRVDFTSRYRNLPQAFTDEVQEYFKLPRANFDTCDPLQWWAGRCLQFPNLSRFARDVLSIPGEFTTVSFLLFDNLLMFPSMKDLLLPLNGFFREVVIQFLFAVQASTQRPSEP
jgi:hypothetical protein